MSNQQVKIVTGTLYGAIENLLKQRLIQSVKSEDKRRKTYVITDKGKEVLQLDCERMNHMIKVTKNLLNI